MIGAYFDIEVFENYVSLLFLDMNVDQQWIDAYIEADIINDEMGKKYALNHIDYKQFILHNDRYDIEAFYLFMKDIKLLIGFNNKHYDDLIIDFLHIKKDIATNPDTHWWLIQNVKMLSDNIIGNSVGNYRYVHDELKLYASPYTSIDLFLALFETINRKSLKQSAINIKWYRIEDLPLKPGSTVTSDQFNTIFEYNFNDVLITRALHKLKHKEFELRINIGARYNVDVLSSNRSAIADKLMIKFYQQYTGLKYYEFKDARTPRTIVKFKDILNPKITFTTSALQTAYNDIYNTAFYVGKKYYKTVIFNNKGYTIATGGLHSIDRPKKFFANEKYDIIDADVSSYYPKLIYNEGVCPAHIAPVAFSYIVNMITTDRLEYKTKSNDLKKLARYAEAADYQVGAEALKIVANSGLYGKLGYDGWLYDLKAMYQVTLNGQLYLMMLIEQLELAGIHVISANTDGITAYVSKDKTDTYYTICKNWQSFTKLELEFTKYIKYIRTSVNDYLAVKEKWLTDPNGEEVFKRKGDFLVDVELSKGFNAPIVAIAINEYYINNIPVEKTIKKHTDIYDFCISVKTGNDFVKQIHNMKDGNYNIQDLSKNLRYYVSNLGGTLLKHSTQTHNHINMLKGYLITPFNDYFKVNKFSEYDINYKYYVKRCNDIILKINNEFSKPSATRRVTGRRSGVKEIGNLFDNI
jgi:hypothetical protein